MKTAMLQHIEHLKIMQNMVSEKSLDKELTETINTTLSGAIENAEHFLETEKQQIIDFANKCQIVRNIDIDGNITFVDPIEFFESTFNEK